MNKAITFSILVLGLCGWFCSVGAQVSPIGTESLNKMPLAFTKNVGQWDERVQFRTSSSGATIWICKDRIVYQFIRTVEDRSGGSVASGLIGSDPVDQFLTKRDSIEQLVIAAKFVGANADVEVVGENIREYTCNYLIGNDPTRWQSDVPNYAAVALLGIYEGVDLRFYRGVDGSLTYQFETTSDAIDGTIQIEYEGLHPSAIDASNNAIFRTDWGDITGVLQNTSTDMIFAPIEFSGLSDGKFRPDTDASSSLQRSPQAVALVFSTYLGGPNADDGFGIAVDKSHNVYVSGATSSGGFPVLNGYDLSLGGSTDAFVTKISSLGDPVFSTFVGGSGSDGSYSIAIDANGNSYITGNTTSSDFPIVLPLDTNLSGGSDAFVAKLSINGDSLLYSSYLGGAGSDEAWGLAVDSGGSAYIVGHTMSSDFPIENALFTSLSGGSDAFVSKISPTGGTLVFSTFLGGTGSVGEDAFSVAVDQSGDAYVTGRTSSPDFPIVNSFQSAFGGGSFDGFASRFSSDGMSLVYSTYLGGSAQDHGRGVAIDQNSNAYLIGESQSADFPLMNAFDSTSAKGAVVVKYSPTGSMLYSTFLAGSLAESGRAIAVDAAGRAYVAGVTYSADFPLLDAFDTELNGSNDAFVTKFSPSGASLIYSSFLGGNGIDAGFAIAVDDSGSAYVTGETESGNFPTLNAYDASYGGFKDAFVTKVSPGQSSLSTCESQAFSDDFSDGNDDGWRGNPEGLWTVTNGVFEASLAVPDPITWRFTGNTDWADMCLSFDLKNIQSRETLVYLRWGQGGTNGYLCMIKPNNGNPALSNLEMLKYVNNSVVQRATYPIVTQLNQWYHFDFELIGGTIACKIDGADAFTYSDPQNSWPNGRFGLGIQKEAGIGQSQVQFDNVTVRCASAEFCLPFANVSGSIVDAANNQPLQGVLVEFLQNSQVQYSTTSDNNGHFEVLGVNQGMYDVRYSFAGYASQTSSVTFAMVETTIPTVVLLPITTIQGQVYQASVFHSPLPGATVEAWQAGILVGSVQSGELGVYALSVPAAVTEIRVSANEYQSLIEPNLNVPPTGLTRDFEILLSEYANMDIQLEFHPSFLEQNIRGATDSLIIAIRVTNTSRGLNNIDFDFTVGNQDLNWAPGSLDGNGDGFIDHIATGSKNIWDTIHVATPWNNVVGARIASIEGWKVVRSISKNISIAYLSAAAPGTSASYRTNKDSYGFHNPGLDPTNNNGLLRKWLDKTDKSLGKWIGLLTAFTSSLKGTCVGMAASSNAYFLTPSEKPAPQPTFSMTLDEPEVANRIIEYHFGSTKRILQTRYQGQSAIELGDQVKSAIEGQRTVVIGLASSIREGHAVSAFKSFSDVNSQKQVIAIYDNELPFPADPRLIEVNRATNAFAGDFDYSHFKTFENLNRPPTDVLLSMIWDEVKSLPGSLFQRTKSMLHISCPVHPLITRSDGKRVGFINDSTWVNEFESSMVVVTLTDEGDSAYYFELESEYSHDILIDAYADDSISLMYFIPSDATSGNLSIFGDVTIGSNSRAKLNLSAFAAHADSIEIDFDGDQVFESTYYPQMTLPPGSARIISPTRGSVIESGPVQLVWTPAVTVISGDSLYYQVVVAIDSAFATIVRTISTSDTVAALADLDGSHLYYWRVDAVNKALQIGPSFPVADFLYRGFTCGDADGSELVTISDIVFLINYIFAGGFTPNPLLSGDADCSRNVNISDAVYLINYIFAGGAIPCEGC